MSTTPEEYFGPHAKRWTSPTGEVLSLRPADYDRMVNIQTELDFTARELERLQQELAPAPAASGIAAAEEEWKAVTNGEGTVYDESWPRVISMDTAYDNIDPEMAALFKERGMITGARMHHASLVKGQEAGHIDGWTPRPVLTEGDNIQVFRNGEASHFTLNADGSIAQIHPFQEEAGEPAARHLKHRKPMRAAAAALLLYVIIVIGVAAVAAVVL